VSNKKVLSAAKHADIFVIPPGSFYTSILPNFLEPEFQKIVQAREAPIVAVANIANECHTRGWSAHRYADQISSAIGRQIDYLIANSGQPPGWLIEQYEAAGQDIVHVGERMSATKYEIVEKDLVTRQEIVIPETTGDVERSVLRHPPHHLGATLLDIFADLGFNRQW